MDTNQIIELLVTLVVTPLITLLFIKFNRLIQEKIDNEKVLNIINMANRFVVQAVATVNQQFVDELKAKGEFTTERAKEAALMALESAKVLLGENGMALLEQATNDVNEYLVTEIEKTVRYTK